MKTVLKKVLIANRGEIACRILRTCHDMGIRTVAVYSDIDRSTMQVSMADEAYALGGTAPAESYLRQDKILDIAVRSGADGIHPGYGFLSENPDFAELVVAAGKTFIGPTGVSIRRLGDKTAARKLALTVGVPTVPGTLEPLQSESEAADQAREIGYPVLLKAAAGGGGKGMRVVATASDLSSAFRSAGHEAQGAFGDDRIYIEKYVSRPRHVEIQILADGHGHVVHLGERECSIQRRHQKLIEESPSTIVDDEMRAAMGEAAVKLAKAGGYTNAGTIEFIVDADRKFYFLEVNTRLQVEHPVTEMTTGIDLVREQILVAQGESLHFSQEDIHPRGHAIECRICAEDPANDFLPSTGKLLAVDPPSGPFIRVENSVRAGDEVSVFYDPLVAKVVAWGEDRPQAIERMLRALDEFVIAGIQTTIPFCRFVLRDQEFGAGRFDTHFVSERFRARDLGVIGSTTAEAAAIAAAFMKSQTAAWMGEGTFDPGATNGTAWLRQKRDFLR